MTKTVRYTMAVVMSLLWLALMFILSGCNMYNIQRCEDGVCSTAEIKSMRKFDSIAFKYNGEARTFELQAGEVSTDSSAIATLAGVIALQAQQNEQE